MILTETPGSGKATAADRIAHLPQSPKIHLRSDYIWHFMAGGLVPVRKPALATRAQC